MLLDGAQGNALPTLPFAAELDVLARSEPLPAALVATVGGRPGAPRWATLEKALLGAARAIRPAPRRSRASGWCASRRRTRRRSRRSRRAGGPGPLRRAPAAPAGRRAGLRLPASHLATTGRRGRTGGRGRAGSRGARGGPRQSEHAATADARAAEVDKAVDAGQRCQQVAPATPACDYALALALGVQAREHPSTANKGLPLMVELLQRATASDPRQDHAGPPRVLALVLLRAPGWPLGPGDPEAGLKARARMQWGSFRSTPGTNWPSPRRCS